MRHWRTGSGDAAGGPAGSVARSACRCECAAKPGASYPREFGVEPVLQRPARRRENIDDRHDSDTPVTFTYRFVGENS